MKKNPKDVNTFEMLKHELCARGGLIIQNGTKSAIMKFNNTILHINEDTQLDAILKGFEDGK